METPQQAEIIFRAFTEIGIINQLVRSAVESVLPGKMRMSHFGVLNHFVRRAEEQSPSHLARAFQVTNAAMTNTLGKMQKWELITIRKDPKDARAKLVSMTNTGKKVHQQATIAISLVMQQMLADLDLETLLRLEPDLKNIREKLDAARD